MVGNFHVIFRTTVIKCQPQQKKKSVDRVSMVERGLSNTFPKVRTFVSISEIKIVNMQEIV